jgi:GNAT superfamily N-acetyltransferase
MSADDIRITIFDPFNATDAEWNGLNELKNIIEAESMPEDPPESVEDHVRRVRAVPPSMDSLFWIAWDGSSDRVLGMGNTSVMAGEANRHILWLSIRVRPEVRRRGIGTRLLRAVAEAARQKDRRLFVATTNSRVLAGEAFMKRLGASMGLSNSSSELKIDDVDEELMQSWQERARKRASDFALGLWEGAYPDDAVEDVMDMYKIMNTAPRETSISKNWSPRRSFCASGPPMSGRLVLSAGRCMPGKSRPGR